MKLEALLANTDRLPSLPKVVQELVIAFDKPDPDVNKIVALIGSDPVLTVKVLQVANSAFFRRSRTISSIKEATVFMGLHTVRLLVMGAGMVGAVRFLDRDSRTQFWRYSLHTAVGARYFARQLQLDGDTAFTAGLIHAIGQPLMRELLEDDLAAVDEAATFYDEQRAALECMALGYGFPDVGAALAESWHFPPQVSQAIRAAPSPFSCMPFSPLGACVHLGMRLASCSERCEAQAAAFSLLDTRVLDTLQLRPDALESMPPMGELTEGLTALIA